MREEHAVSVQVLRDEMQIDRVLADLGSNEEGNTLMIVGGIHGNEVMGLAALQNVISHLQEHDVPIKGRFLALTGNMEASRLGQRFLYKDLNRLWTRENIDALHYNKLDIRHTENREMKIIYDQIQDAVAHCKGQLILADLHTTSGETSPFLVTHYTDRCLDFTAKFPLPVIGGLAGFLDGTLFGYLNELGHTGLAYEAGQHKSPYAMASHESFIWQALYHSGICPDLDPNVLDFHRKSLEESSVEHGKRFRIISRYKIDDDENFKMHEGYSNFQEIKEGEKLAHNDDGPIQSPYDGLIFMPLYQDKGSDGFFIIKEEA